MFAVTMLQLSLPRDHRCLRPDVLPEKNDSDNRVPGDACRQDAFHVFQLPTFPKYFISISLKLRLHYNLDYFPCTSEPP